MSDHTITAHQINQQTGMAIFPAPLGRPWMDGTHEGFAYRCLPLNIANQNGWWITCPFGFAAYWNGSNGTMETQIKFDGDPHPYVKSHFGSGVITFSVPYLFRTPPGVNLWVRGPSNLPKDGVAPLEGIVETDWAVSTFTMNWKITRPHHWIRFDAGEPFCMIVPIPRGLTESLTPRLTMIHDSPDLHERYRHWERSRRDFAAAWAAGEPDARQQAWQKDYFKGQTTQGEGFRGHQTKLVVKPFPIVAEPPAHAESSKETN